MQKKPKSSIQFSHKFLHWCNFNDTGVVTSEPPGCNYDQNLGYCTSFAFLMVQNLYFSTACCGRQTAVCTQSSKISSSSSLPVPGSCILPQLRHLSTFPHRSESSLQHESCKPHQYVFPSTCTSSWCLEL